MAQRADPARSSKMNEREHNNRVEALQNAVRHRLREETPKDIVKSAEEYFEFLQGEKAES